MNKQTNYRVFIRPIPAPAQYAAPADPQGTYHGVKFTNGVATLLWKELGEDATYDLAQRFGSDPLGRFDVQELIFQNQKPT